MADAWAVLMKFKIRWPDLAIVAVPVIYVVAAMELLKEPPITNGVAIPILAASLAPITPLQPTTNLDREKVALGRQLFHDPRLSKNGAVSCASCHNLTAGGADVGARSFGVSGEPTATNTPTVFNSANNVAQFWDGRAATLEEQIDGPLQHPDEMGSTWQQTIGIVSADPTYVDAFFSIYGGPASPERIRDAIAEFERTLVTLDAPFDRFLRGDKTAITAEARRGYERFQTYGCISCHQGRNVGGNIYQRLGIVEPYFGEDEVTPANLGRFNVTGHDADRHVFKVPSLRNVALTAPYFHDGSVETLEQAIAIMGFYQLGRALPQSDIADIAAFLRSLTGQVQEAAWQ